MPFHKNPYHVLELPIQMSHARSIYTNMLFLRWFLENIQGHFQEFKQTRFSTPTTSVSLVSWINSRIFPKNQRNSIISRNPHHSSNMHILSTSVFLIPWTGSRKIARNQTKQDYPMEPMPHLIPKHLFL